MAGAEKNERLLIYAGAGTDMMPMYIACVGAEHHKLVEACAKGTGSDSPEIIADVLSKVDRFVLFDSDPYGPPFVSRGELDGRWFPTFDHFLKFMDVYLRMTAGCLETVTHHEDDKYFECFVGFSDEKKTLEYHYGANFNRIDKKSRLYDLMQRANVLYVNAFIPTVGENSRGDTLPEFYSAFPNVDTVLWQEFVKHDDVQAKFEKHSVHEHVRLVIHPSVSSGMGDLW